ncbi:MAG: family 20 glycosylhydrolase [Sphaerochaetaceae bacterium]|nr:family 20 glycosylhydrolase [Sphaerochaetaceae bacterium]
MKPEDSVYQEQFIGGQGNLWTEYITDPEEAQYMLFPRLCAISEALWLPVEKKDYDSFVRRWHHHAKRLEALNIRYYQGEL